VPEGVSTATKKMESECPPGVTWVSVALLMTDIVVLAEATEGEADTAPVSAKVAGRNAPEARKNMAAISPQSLSPLRPRIQTP